MKGSGDKLSPEVWTVYAVASEHRRRLGEWPSAEVIRKLAEAQGANPDAVLVLTRFELPAADGSGGFVKLRGGCRAIDSHVVIRDAETMRAILSTGWAVTATMKTPDGALIQFRKLDHWVSAWETMERLASM